MPNSFWERELRGRHGIASKNDRSEKYMRLEANVLVIFKTFYNLPVKKYRAENVFKQFRNSVVAQH